MYGHMMLADYIITDIISKRAASTSARGDIEKSPTALVLEDYIVERILRSPGFHSTVRRIHRKVQDQRHGRDPNEPLHPGEATELPGANENKSFPKYFVEELMNQFRGSPTNPPPPPGPPRKPR
ncbi:hypothetical protein N8I77_013409 [Diaporthe amygdali]|uniref:Uncharacterized protein n=1 Tax=Phomopsis amygdali TaxID=1214568 RepID=A0AAD9S235_PHOAM|nr:hypothetical protein N8I77_013409 [Diaporthe amygdali]